MLFKFDKNLDGGDTRRGTLSRWQNLTIRSGKSPVKVIAMNNAWSPSF